MSFPGIEVPNIVLITKANEVRLEQRADSHGETAASYFDGCVGLVALWGRTLTEVENVVGMTQGLVNVETDYYDQIDVPNLTTQADSASVAADNRRRSWLTRHFVSKDMPEVVPYYIRTKEPDLLRRAAAHYDRPVTSLLQLSFYVRDVILCAQDNGMEYIFVDANGKPHPRQVHRESPRL